MSFWLYILRCSDGTFYIGHTDALELRLSQHDTGIASAYTAELRPIELVFSEEFPTREEAFARERQIKNWSRAKKQALIDQDWERLSELARGPNKAK